MPLTIDAPDVESRLQKEATRRGMTVADYARHLLESSLDLEQEAATENGDRVETRAEMPAHTMIPAASWSQAFDAWIDGHPNRPALPENAFERSSFYPDNVFPDKELA